MLHSCNKCPNMSETETYLLDHFYDCNFDSDDTVNFKEWIQNKRGISLVKCPLLVDEFVKEICCKFDNL